MRPVVLAALVLMPVQTPAPAVSVPLDLTRVRPGPVGVVRDGNSVSLTWPDETARVWRATFSLDPAQPLNAAITAHRKKKRNFSGKPPTCRRPGRRNYCAILTTIRTFP